VLATSREPLHVAAEREYPIEPLPEEDAVTLFVERGRRMQPSFARDDATAALCRRLDCLPLALELAAARTNVLTAQQILERLERHEDLLTTGARDAPGRHKTLHATIDWSYELLADHEKQLFTQLAVFAGGCSLEAAEAVCDADLDTLASLVDKSLVRWRGDRFVMLETIREFAAALLEKAGQSQRLRRRHLEYFLALVERDDPGSDAPHIAALVTADYANLRAAMTWAVTAAPELALRLGTMLWSSWGARGMLAEGRRWLSQALRRTPDEASTTRARALLGASWLAYLAGDDESSTCLGEAALAAARAIDDPPLAVRALNALGAAACSVADYERAQRHFEDAATLARQCGHIHGLSAALGNLGNIAYDHREWDEAIALYTEQLSLHPGWPAAVMNIALAELQAGRDVAAIAARYHEAFRRFSESGEALYAAIALWGLGLTAARAARSDPAIHVLAAAAAQRATLGYALDTSDRALDEHTLEDLRAQVGEEVFAAAWAEGRLLDPEDAAALAVESIRSASPASAASGPPRP
jgi:tetratricopeptide (TPR) repeat protein